MDDLLFTAKEPIRAFDNDFMLEGYLKYWVDKLFLHDWIIHVHRKDFNDPPLNGRDMGFCDADYTNQCAVIHLARADSLPEDCSMTISEEHNLVHELLHIRYPVFTDHSYESDVVAGVTHAKLEKMAKTLLMVRYDIPFSWFDHTMKQKGEST